MKIVRTDELKEFEGLDPSIYSKRKFIEFIARYLKAQGNLSKEYTFTEGKNIKIEEIIVSENKTNVKIGYEKSVAPSGSITQFTAEYGKTFPPESETINITVNRKTYPLDYITIPEVVASISAIKSELAYLQNGDSISYSRENKNAIGPNDKVMAAGGIFADTTGQRGSLISNISRRSRHFWGSSDKQDGDEDYLNGFSDSLGSLPSEITVDHGPFATHFVIATTGNIEVLAQGMKMGAIVLDLEINCYPGNPSYSRNYKIYIGTGTSTGTYKYQIRK